MLTHLSKHAPRLVVNHIDMINWFMTTVSELVKEEYCMAMLVDDMYIS